MDITQRRIDLEKRQADERAALETQLDLLQALPEDFAHLEWMAHAYKLYDRAASLHAHYQRYSSIQKKANPTLADVRAFAAAFPVTPVCVFRDGSVGIRTRANVDSMPDARLEQTIVTHIAPLWITIDPASFSQELRLHWIATIAGRLVDVQFEFPLHGAEARALGSLQLRYDYADPAHNYIRGVAVNTFSIDRAMHVFGDCKAAQIRYASGSHDTPGHHLIYWEDHSGSVTDVTVETLADALAARIV